MSVASTWDEKLRKLRALHDYPGQQALLVGYQDLRSLVDDALALERIRAFIHQVEQTVRLAGRGEGERLAEALALVAKR